MQEKLCAKINSSFHVSNTLASLHSLGSKCQQQYSAFPHPIACGVHTAVHGSHPSQALFALSGANELAVVLQPQASFIFCLTLSCMAKTKAVHVYKCVHVDVAVYMRTVLCASER